VTFKVIVDYRAAEHSSGGPYFLQVRSDFSESLINDWIQFTRLPI
jgi:hypothetical protein